MLLVPHRASSRTRIEECLPDMGGTEEIKYTGWAKLFCYWAAASTVASLKINGNDPESIRCWNTTCMAETALMIVLLPCRKQNYHITFPRTKGYA